MWFRSVASLVFVSACCLLSVDGYITWIAARLPLQGNEAPPGAPWPMPASYNPSTTQYTVDPETFKFESNVPGCDVIDEAFARYLGLMFARVGSPAPGLTVVTTVSVSVVDASCDAAYYPPTDMDEQYSLGEDGFGSVVTISSGSIWGALRGLETFSQLLYLNENNNFLINETVVVDQPRFSHRGILLDTARHFLPLETIYEVLDALSWDKFNVMHWHIVDAQSFPFESTTYPNMSKLGAYQSWMTYSHNDVTAVMDYARKRGIRIIPEFDTPGHTYSWGYSLPDLLTPCWGDGLEGGPYVPKYGEFAEKETLNPSQEYTYEVVGNIWSEVIALFKDEYVHLGVDEAYHRCWASNPNISEWMSTMGFTNYKQVGEFYVKRLIDIIEEKQNKYMIWEDPINNNVSVNTDAVVCVWKDTALDPNGEWPPWQQGMLQATALGHRAILYSPWYINYIEYGPVWKDYYQVEPFNFTSDENLQNLLLGGSATAWAEYIDQHNIMSVLWPSLSAVGERLWSRAEINDVDEAQFRLDQQRCRFVGRGVPTKPLLPGYCLEDNPNNYPSITSGSSFTADVGKLIFSVTAAVVIASRYLTLH